jgi:hypothetical protein
MLFADQYSRIQPYLHEAQLRLAPATIMMEKLSRALLLHTIAGGSRLHEAPLFERLLHGSLTNISELYWQADEACEHSPGFDDVDDPTLTGAGLACPSARLPDAQALSPATMRRAAWPGGRASPKTL